MMTISYDVFRSQCIEFAKRCQELNDDWCVMECSKSGRLSSFVDTSKSDSNKPIILVKNELKTIPSDGKLCNFEYTICYSHSYGVPVMYFSANDQAGRPVSVEQVIAPIRESLSKVINQVEHPLIFRPFYMVHPCRTANFMKSVSDKEINNYLISWLSTVGTLININVHPNLGKSTNR